MTLVNIKFVRLLEKKNDELRAMCDDLKLEGRALRVTVENLRMREEGLRAMCDEYHQVVRDVLFTPTGGFNIEDRPVTVLQWQRMHIVQSKYEAMKSTNED